MRSTMRLPFEATGNVFAVEARNGIVALKTLPAHRFNFINYRRQQPEACQLRKVQFVAYEASRSRMNRDRRRGCFLSPPRSALANIDKLDRRPLLSKDTPQV